MSNIDNTYSKMVTSLRETESRTIFPNKGKVHANIVLSNIFKSAKKNVNMLTGSMKEEVLLEEFKSSLKSFLKKDNVSLRVIFEEAPSEENPLIELLKKEENVTMFQAPKDIENTFFNGKKYHFTTADEKSFRLENDVDSFKAICSFYSPKRCEVLNTIFENILIKSQKI